VNWLGWLIRQTLIRWEDTSWSLAGQEHLGPLCTLIFLNRSIEFLFPPTSEARNSMFDETLAHALGATEFFTCSYNCLACPIRCY